MTREPPPTAHAEPLTRPAPAAGPPLGCSSGGHGDRGTRIWSRPPCLLGAQVIIVVGFS